METTSLREYEAAAAYVAAADEAAVAAATAAGQWDPSAGGGGWIRRDAAGRREGVFLADRPRGSGRQYRRAEECLRRAKAADL